MAETNVEIARKTVATIADAVDEMAVQINSTDKRAAQWTHDIAAFIRAFEIEQTQ